jgi:hypothetical protein
VGGGDLRSRARPAVELAPHSAVARQDVVWCAWRYHGRCGHAYILQYISDNAIRGWCRCRGVVRGGLAATPGGWSLCLWSLLRVAWCGCVLFCESCLCGVKKIDVPSKNVRPSHSLDTSALSSAVPRRRRAPVRPWLRPSIYGKLDSTLPVPQVARGWEVANATLQRELNRRRHR